MSFQRVVKLCSLPLRHSFRESCRSTTIAGRGEPHRKSQRHWQIRLVCKCLKYSVYYATVGFGTAAAANPIRGSVAPWLFREFEGL